MSSQAEARKKRPMTGAVVLLHLGSDGKRDLMVVLS